jgi:hypothetical protein
MIITLRWRNQGGILRPDLELDRSHNSQTARKTSVPLVPPKPKEFESAILIFIDLAVLGT